MGDLEWHNMRSLSRLSPSVSLAPVWAIWAVDGYTGEVRRVLPRARLLKIVQRGEKWDVGTPSGSCVGDSIFNTDMGSEMSGIATRSLG